VATFTSQAILTVDPMYQQKPHLAVGCFEEDKLRSYICCGAAGDAWVLDLMVSAQDNPRALRDCLETCLAHYESQGVRQFYYAFPNKWARAYRTFWREGAPLLRRYTIEDRCIIEANKKPTDAWIWKHVLHETVVPVDFLLRRSYLP
jgi:hypothetical protein